MNTNDYVLSAVIVTYKPDLNILYKNLNSLLNQVEKIVIIDNTPNGFTLSDKFKTSKIYKHSFNDNLGLSYALNFGYDYSFNVLKGVTHIISFDQDSVCSNDVVLNLVSEYSLLSNTEKIGVIGINYFDEKLHSFTQSTSKTNKTDVVITSGSLFSKEVYLNCGKLDENLFIDMIDYEWCYRLISKGYVNYLYNTSKMSHNLGDSTINFFVKKPIHFNTIRHYYIIRNTFYLLKLKHIPFSWKIVSFFKNVRRTIAYPIFSTNKTESLYLVYRGYYDFFIGCFGAFKK